MFGRVTRIVALIAVTTYVWVALVAAPWHHLTAHLLPAVKSAGNRDVSQTVTHCRCRHHTRGSSSTITSNGCRHYSNAGQGPTEQSPEDENGCTVCQVLAQPFVHLDVSSPTLTWEQMDFIQSVAAIQPLLGSLIDPTTRGPPAA